MEREKKCRRVYSVKVASSCSYGDNVVARHVLNQDVLSKLGQRDVKQLKLLFEKNLCTKEVTQVCNALNQYLEIGSDKDNEDDFTNDSGAFRAWVEPHSQ